MTKVAMKVMIKVAIVIQKRRFHFLFYLHVLIGRTFGLLKIIDKAKYYRGFTKLADSLQRLSKKLASEQIWFTKKPDYLEWMF